MFFMKEKKEEIIIIAIIITIITIKIVDTCTLLNNVFMNTKKIWNCAVVFFQFWLADYFYEKMNKVGLLIIYTYTKTAESHFLMEI